MFRLDRIRRASADPVMRFEPHDPRKLFAGNRAARERGEALGRGRVGLFVLRVATCSLDHVPGKAKQPTTPIQPVSFGQLWERHC
ncbi:MAG: hypothetical protein O3B04_09305 [Chloroflexi bacterium]|nr:hypothetical protein [Chloroflexota bacterium]